ncbi:MAPEG family protein [Enterobacter hormaechei]
MLLRIAHSLVQATFNRVSIRFLFFLLSTLALVALTASAGMAVLGR